MRSNQRLTLANSGACISIISLSISVCVDVQAQVLNHFRALLTVDELPTPPEVIHRSLGPGTLIVRYLRLNG